MQGGFIAQVAGVGQGAPYLLGAVAVRFAAADVPAGEMLCRGIAGNMVGHKLNMFQGLYLRKGRVFAPETGGGQMHGLDYLYIACAAAVIMFQPLADFLVGGVGVRVQERLGRKHHSGRAEAALHGADVEKGLLDGVQGAVFTPKPLDGCDFFPVQPVQPGYAGAYRPAVDDDGTGSAVAGAAALFGAFQTGHAPKVFQKGLTFGLGGDESLIQFKRYISHICLCPCQY